jgi:hypothetical protein
MTYSAAITHCRLNAPKKSDVGAALSLGVFRFNKNDPEDEAEAAAKAAQAADRACIKWFQDKGESNEWIAKQLNVCAL